MNKPISHPRSFRGTLRREWRVYCALCDFTQTLLVPLKDDAWMVAKRLGWGHRMTPPFGVGWNCPTCLAEQK